MLREARESMHVDIAVLAAMLKVPEHKLLALEADRFDALPDLTFARALAASVCRMLQIDPAPVLAKFPQPAHGIQRAQPAPINSPYRTARESSMAARTGSVLQGRYIWLVLAILLGAVVLALLPNLERLSSADAPAPAPTAAASAAAPVASEPASSAVAAAPLADASAAAPMAVASAALAPAAAASVPAAGMPVLRLAAGKDSWVQVREAGGKTLISRTIKAGETVDLDGQAPYKVVVGNTEGLTLSVRGQAFDFSTVTKTTTARFELN